MQLFARLRPALLRRLRRVLQLAVPGVVAADTVRSCVVTYQLAQERFREWEDEDQEATRAEVAALLRRVARRCAATDPDFWPRFQTAVASAGGAVDGGVAGMEVPLAANSSSSGSSVHQAGQAEDGLAGDMWQLLGLGPGASGPTSSSSNTEPTQQSSQRMQQQAPPSAASAEQAAWAEAEAAQLLRFEHAAADARAAGAAGSAAGVASAAATAAQARAAVVVVTLSEALSHVANEVTSLDLPWTSLLAPPPGVVYVTLSDVVSILASTPPARAAASKGERLGARLGAAADAAAASARAALPWPQLALSRRSALRCSVQWQGLSWPSGGDEEVLERDLSCC